MKLSDKALGKIGLDLFRRAPAEAVAQEPTPSRHKRTAGVRDIRSAASLRDRKATVLTFRKRHR